jgi:hypothetical protein
MNGTLTARKLDLEVWFPAVVGSEKGAEKYFYRPSSHLPDDQRSKMPPCPASDPYPKVPTCCEPAQYFDRTWANLPMDTEHGPYPVIVFVHGTAAYRQYFLHIVEHWVSRGFVVVATDYPGITMKDELTKLELKPTPKTDQVGDTKLLIEELTTLKDERLAFLRGKINITNLGITGHSAGGFATGDLSATMGRVMIPMAGNSSLLVTFGPFC